MFVANFSDPALGVTVAIFQCREWSSVFTLALGPQLLDIRMQNYFTFGNSIFNMIFFWCFLWRFTVAETWYFSQVTKRVETLSGNIELEMDIDLYRQSFFCSRRTRSLFVALLETKNEMPRLFIHSVNSKLKSKTVEIILKYFIFQLIYDVSS